MNEVLEAIKAAFKLIVAVIVILILAVVLLSAGIVYLLQKGSTDESSSPSRTDSYHDRVWS